MAANIPVQVIINAVDNASKVFTQVGSGLTGMTKSVMNLSEGQVLLASSLVGLGVAAGAMGKSFVSAAGDMEQNKIAFEVMLGSADRAKKMLEDLTSFAARTPFNLQGVVEAGKQLLAYGFAQEEVIGTTEMLGNVAAGLKIPLGDIIYLFGTLRAQGRAYTKDLNQFTARGIPILDALAKQYGITTAEVFKFAETGKIGFEDVEKAFQGMTSQGGQFFNLMDRQSQSTLGRVSNFEDSVYQLKVALGEALLPSVNNLVTALIPLVKQLGEFAKTNPEVVTSVLGLSAALGGIGTTVLVLGPIFKAFGAAIDIVIVSMKYGRIAALAFQTALGPIGWISLAIIAIVALLATAWVNNWGDIQGKTKAVINYLMPAFDSVIAMIGKLRDWIVKIPDYWNSSMDRLKAIGDSVVGFVTNVGIGFRLLWDFISGGDPTIKASEQSMAGFAQVLSGWRDTIIRASEATMQFIQTAIAQFQALPEAISILMGMAGSAIYEFFFGTIPFAVGFAVGRLERFITTDLPAFATLLTVFFTTTLPQTLVAFGATFQQMLIDAGIALTTFALVTVPNAFLSMITWLQVNIPILTGQMIQWFSQMTTAIVGILIGFKDQSVATVLLMGAGVVSGLIWMKENGISTIIAMKNSAVQWVMNMKDDIVKIVNELPNLIQKAFDTAKNNAINAAKSLWEGVSNWMNQVKQLFQDIIDTASRAIEKASQAFSIGRDQGKRQFGGPVSSSNSYLVGEKGPEIFTPSTAGHITPNNNIGAIGGGGGTTIQFFINAETIINSPNERRSFAEALIKDLAVIANAKNLSVSELLGDIK